MSSVSITPRGLALGRFVKALAVGRGDPMAALGYASGQRWNDTPSVVEGLKAMVDPSSIIEDVGAPTLASPIATDLAEMVRAQTIVGRLTGLRRVPHNCRLVRVATGTSGHWSGETTPIPMGALHLEADGLDMLKVSSGCVITSELARAPGAGAEAAIGREVAGAVAAAMDAAFVDASNAGSTGVKPESITHAGTEIPSSGSSIAQLDGDLRAAVEVLDSADVDPASMAWTMRPSVATFLGSLRGASGAPAFPGLGPRGGLLLGVPVLTSGAAPIDGDSPRTSSIALIGASEVYLADDGLATIDLATSASVQMVDNPDQDLGPETLVSLWQAGLVGVKATRYVNWRLRRAAGCAVITGVSY